MRTLILLAASFVLLPALASAQEGAPTLPAGYGPPPVATAVTAPSFGTTPWQAGSAAGSTDLEIAVAAIERGDRRTASRTLRLMRRTDRSPHLTLLSSAIDLRLSPSMILGMSDDAAAQAASELDAIRAESSAAIALGIIGAATGGISLFLSLIAAIVDAVPSCSGSIFSGSFSCTSNSGTAQSIFTASGIAGGVSLAATTTAIALTVDAGSRRGAFVERIRLGGFSDGATASVEVGVEGSL